MHKIIFYSEKIMNKLNMFLKIKELGNLGKKSEYYNSMRPLPKEHYLNYLQRIKLSKEINDLAKLVYCKK